MRESQPPQPEPVVEIQAPEIVQEKVCDRLELPGLIMDEKSHNRVEKLTRVGELGQGAE